MLSNRKKAEYWHDLDIAKAISKKAKSPPALEVLSIELCKGQKALSSNPTNISPTGKAVSVLGKAKKGCLIVGLLGTLTLGNAVAQAAPMDRSLSLYNIHTKESLSITYKRGGKYDRKSLDKINWFLRDWRNNQTTKMDPELIDLMWEVHKDLGSKKPIHVVSSYRSPKTNNMLRRIGRKVARNSQHTKGRAVDVFFPDISSKKIRENALIRELGGVGYYPRSLSKGFVHLDTGSVRHWPRMHAKTFARLFPYGKSKHRPRSYPSKALYAKYRGKTPEPHIQMALASKSGNTPDVRLNQNIQLASLKPKSPKPSFAQKPVEVKSEEPKSQAPIVLTSAKILEEKVQPVAQKPEENKKPQDNIVQVQQLAKIDTQATPSITAPDPLNKPVAHGLKPITIATVEKNLPLIADPNNKPVAHGMKPIDVAANMDVKIIPAAATPEDTETKPVSVKPQKSWAPKVEVAALEPLPENINSRNKPVMTAKEKQSEKVLPPLELAFSKASLLPLGKEDNIVMPKVNRAIKGDLLMTNLYKSPPKPKLSHRGSMGKTINMSLSLTLEDNTGIIAA